MQTKFKYILVNYAMAYFGPLNVAMIRKFIAVDTSVVIIDLFFFIFIIFIFMFDKHAGKDFFYIHTNFAFSAARSFLIFCNSANSSAVSSSSSESSSSYKIKSDKYSLTLINTFFLLSAGPQRRNINVNFVSIKM